MCNCRYNVKQCPKCNPPAPKPMKLSIELSEVAVHELIYLGQTGLFGPSGLAKEAASVIIERWLWENTGRINDLKRTIITSQ
jgi:hypothetical protein